MDRHSRCSFSKLLAVMQDLLFKLNLVTTQLSHFVWGHQRYGLRPQEWAPTLLPNVVHAWQDHPMVRICLQRILFRNCIAGLSGFNLFLQVLDHAKVCKEARATLLWEVQAHLAENGTEPMVRGCA